MNKTYSLKHFVYLVGLHIYYKMIHGPYNVTLMTKLTVAFRNFADASKNSANYEVLTAVCRNP